MKALKVIKMNIKQASCIFFCNSVSTKPLASTYTDVKIQNKQVWIGYFLYSGACICLRGLWIDESFLSAPFRNVVHGTYYLSHYHPI